MAIWLPANTDGIGYGTFDDVNGLVSLSLAFTLRLLALPAAESQVITKYGVNVADDSFGVGMLATGALKFYIVDSSHQWRGVQTSQAVNFAKVGVNRVVCRYWQSGNTSYFDVSVNGAAPQQGSVVTNNTINPDPAATLCVGYNPVNEAIGVAGIYSEVSIWKGRLPDWFTRAYTGGASPLVYLPGLLFYAPLTNTPHDIWRGRRGGVVASAPQQVAQIPTFGDVALPWAQMEAPVRVPYLQMWQGAGGVAPTFPALTLAP